jgi:hypothetical protein
MLMRGFVACTFRHVDAVDGQHRHACTHARCGRVVISPYAEPAAIHAVCGGPRLNRVKSLRGLGDALAWLLRRFGVHRFANCSCAARQELLNQLVPFRGWGLARRPRRSKEERSTADFADVRR